MSIKQINCSWAIYFPRKASISLFVKWKIKMSNSKWICSDKMRWYKRKCFAKFKDYKNMRHGSYNPFIGKIL